jgi:SAM-dependent methyltransferase
MPGDGSSSYEAVADEFIALRSVAGTEIVRAWAASLPLGSCVIDVGAGSGEPVTRTLIEEGLRVWAIEPSSTLAEAFRLRCPEARLACEPVERSTFFERSFDGVVAIGIIFLLPEHDQLALLRRVRSVLRSGGRFLFSAPSEACVWLDALTGKPSRSLGTSTYSQLLGDIGMSVVKEREDGGGNHYYDVVKPSVPGARPA